MKLIYLSPHLDDVIFSCGGLIRDQVDRGDDVEIWTIFSGDPPIGELSPFAQSLHDRWQLGWDASAPRRAEDVRACAAVGAIHRHFELPDCIYRKHPISQEFLYDGEAKLFGELAEVEIEHLVPALAQTWERLLPENAHVLSPLGLGGHVDHKLVRRAADLLLRPLRYYADVPYVFAWGDEIPNYLPENTTKDVYEISERGMQAWIAGNAAYESQISTFWQDVDEMEVLFRGYAERSNGLCLWRKRGEPLPGFEPRSRT